MKELYLIRHGKTEANENRQYCGSSNLPLSDEGKALLADIRYHIPENCSFLTSGMLRTEQTLQLLFGNRLHRQDPRFREIDFGTFELHTYEELKDDPAYQIWISRDGASAPPHGESLDAFRQRILAGLQDLLQQDIPTVLVTHGGVIALIMEHLFPGEEKNRYQWQPEPGCGYKLTDNTYQPLERS